MRDFLIFIRFYFFVP